MSSESADYSRSGGDDRSTSTEGVAMHTPAISTVHSMRTRAEGGRKDGRGKEEKEDGGGQDRIDRIESHRITDRLESKERGRGWAATSAIRRPRLGRGSAARALSFANTRLVRLGHDTLGRPTTRACDRHETRRQMAGHAYPHSISISGANSARLASHHALPIHESHAACPPTPLALRHRKKTRRKETKSKTKKRKGSTATHLKNLPLIRIVQILVLDVHDRLCVEHVGELFGEQLLALAARGGVVAAPELVAGYPGRREHAISRRALHSAEQRRGPLYSRAARTHASVPTRAFPPGITSTTGSREGSIGTASCVKGTASCSLQPLSADARPARLPPLCSSPLAHAAAHDADPASYSSPALAVSRHTAPHWARVGSLSLQVFPYRGKSASQHCRGRRDLARTSSLRPALFLPMYHHVLWTWCVFVDPCRPTHAPAPAPMTPALDSPAPRRRRPDLPSQSRVACSRFPQTLAPARSPPHARPRHARPRLACPAYLPMRNPFLARTLAPAASVSNSWVLCYHIAPRVAAYHVAVIPALSRAACMAGRRALPTTHLREA
ncbi:hypothetical protein DFH08DRAFT_974496 [Mycena albidolilacea]|uniref:Uncharacterized protein n=1 Tax=Mycena albidolilacea TaxID=1033008 RepID=A0AAD6Z6W5_9AGAR|nr:hypothetical protein DFH08DRAFT_974496 [Mycena albidolilacea]